jgi:hypothetical protein
MNEYQVNCVTKPNRNSPHEHITHIGNAQGGWRLTREAAIARIESKREAYYTMDRTTGKKVFIGVAREAGKLPYLRTYADGRWNDNLLAQAECGAICRALA